jgi:hypothetical protein
MGINKFSSLEDTIVSYLQTKNITFEGKNINTGKIDSMYYPKIISFKGFMNKKLEDNNQWLFLLTNLKPKDIEESMEYYIDESRKSTNPTNHVKKRSVLDNYRTVIYEYFKFLSVNEVKNNILITTFDLWEDDTDAFAKVMNRVSKKKGLIETIKTSEPISEDEFNTLLNVCNKFMEKFNNINPILDDYNYKRYLRALIVKLMLFSGIRCEVLSSIKAVDYNILHNTITINNFCIHLPSVLGEQLYIYKTKLRNYIVEDCKKKGFEISESLFINSDGSTGIPGSKNDLGSNRFFEILYWQK